MPCCPLLVNPILHTLTPNHSTPRNTLDNNITARWQLGELKAPRGAPSYRIVVDEMLVLIRGPSPAGAAMNVSNSTLKKGF